MALEGFTGFEPRVFSTAGGGLFDGLASAPTPSSSIVRNGSGSMRCNTVGTYFREDMAAATIKVAQFGIYAATLPGAGVTTDIFRLQKSTAPNERFGIYLDSAGMLTGYLNDGTTYNEQAGVPIGTGSWKLVEVLANMSANPWVVSWRIGGIAQTALTKAVASVTLNQMFMGVINDPPIIDIYFDDVAWYTGATGDYPTDQIVLPYVPSASGTHVLAGTGSPTSSVLDDFNRADEGPPPSGSWGTVFGTGLEVSVNQVKADTGDSAGYWSTSSFGPDCEAYVTLPTLSAGTPNYRSLILRITGAYSGYQFEFGKLAGTDELRILRVDNGVNTQLGAVVLQEYAAGDSFWFRAVGTTLTGYYKSGAGAWTEVISRTDATYTTAGHIGLYLGSTTDRADNFGGGTVSAGASSAFFQHDGITQTPLSVGETTSWALLDEVPIGSDTGRVGISAGSSPAVTHYAEHAFENTLETGTPIAVRAYDAIRNTTVAAGANSITGKVAESGSEANIYSALDIASETLIYKSATLLTKPSGGAWTTAAVNALTHRWGYTTNPSSTPRLDGTMVEVLFPYTAPAPGGTASNLALMGVG